MKLPRFTAITASLCVVGYLGMVVFGVIFLTEGKIVLGIILLVLTVMSLPSFIWIVRNERRRFANRNARSQARL